jgi:hypothetical protein
LDSNGLSITSQRGVRPPTAPRAVVPLPSTPCPEINLTTTKAFQKQTRGNGTRYSDEQINQMNQAVASVLSLKGEPTKAERLLGCGAQIKVYCEGCGSLGLAARYCMMRCCLRCEKKAADRRVKKALRALGSLEFPYGWSHKMLTLTSKGTGYAKEDITKFSNDLTKFWNNILWRDKAGRTKKECKKQKAAQVCRSFMLGALEFGPKTLNPHGHFVLASPFIHQSEMLREWQRITKTSGNVYITRVGSMKSAVKEIMKYTSDVAKLSPDQVAEMIIAMSGTRRVRSFGIVRLVDPEYLEPKLEKTPCEHCGCTSFVTEEELDRRRRQYRE